MGVYAPSTDASWVAAPSPAEPGSTIQDVGIATDDWVTDPATFTTSTPPTGGTPSSRSVVWTLDQDKVDHDALLRVGPVVEASRSRSAPTRDRPVVISTDIPALSGEVAVGSEQGRTTVVVLVVQLLVLVAVVLWMVLVAATDDRRPELALARLRGRGRRGAAAYLLAELLP